MKFRNIIYPNSNAGKRDISKSLVSPSSVGIEHLDVGIELVASTTNRTERLTKCFHIP